MPGFLQIAGLKGLIDLHALLPQRFGCQNLGAHDGFQGKAQPAADTIGQPQKQGGQGRTDNHHNEPDGGACKILTPDGFGENLSHSLFRNVNQLADEHHRVGKAMRVTDEQIQKKAQNQGIE